MKVVVCFVVVLLVVASHAAMRSQRYAQRNKRAPIVPLGNDLSNLLIDLF